MKKNEKNKKNNRWFIPVSMLRSGAHMENQGYLDEWQIAEGALVRSLIAEGKIKLKRKSLLGREFPDLPTDTFKKDRIELSLHRDNHLSLKMTKKQMDLIRKGEQIIGQQMLARENERKGKTSLLGGPAKKSVQEKKAMPNIPVAKMTQEEKRAWMKAYLKKRENPKKSDFGIQPKKGLVVNYKNPGQDTTKNRVEALTWMNPRSGVITLTYLPGYFEYEARAIHHVKDKRYGEIMKKSVDLHEGIHIWHYERLRKMTADPITRFINIAGVHRRGELVAYVTQILYLKEKAVELKNTDDLGKKTAKEIEDEIVGVKDSAEKEIPKLVDLQKKIKEAEKDYFKFAGREKPWQTSRKIQPNLKDH